MSHFFLSSRNFPLLLNTRFVCVFQLILRNLLKCIFAVLGPLNFLIQALTAVTYLENSEKLFPRLLRAFIRRAETTYQVLPFENHSFEPVVANLRLLKILFHKTIATLNFPPFFKFAYSIDSMHTWTST